MRVELSVERLAATRFAVSPLFETIAAVRALSTGNWLHRDWCRWAQQRLREQPVPLPWLWSLMIEADHNPEFVLPAPHNVQPTLDEELDLMLRTTPAQVADELFTLYPRGVPPGIMSELSAAPRRGLNSIVEEIRAAHQALIAPHWPRIESILNADISLRARQLAVEGAAELLADLHPGLSWNAAGHLDVTAEGDSARLAQDAVLGPGGLVLIPSVFIWPSLWVKPRSITQTTIRYPAYGPATLWSTRQQGSEDRMTSLRKLLGSTRAELLMRTEAGSTTTELAKAVGVTPGAVSQHVSVLRDAGLVVSETSGRKVTHRTSVLGSQLLGSFETPLDRHGPGHDHDLHG
jgi:DNA-binding transcriptional ArsR family regulator